MSLARKAIGFEGGNQVSGLILRGNVTSGVNRLTGTAVNASRHIEIRILLPDQYLRIETDDTSERRSGFSGSLLLNRWQPLRAGVQIVADFPPQQIVAERMHLARLMLGMLGITETAITLRSKSVDVNTVESFSEDRSVGQLDLEEGSMLPLRLRYPETLRLITPATEEERKSGTLPLTQRKTVEVSLMFEDRRPLDRLKLPYRIRRVADVMVLETITFDTIVLNPKLSAQDFAK